LQRQEDIWLALMIGNSRLHWAKFRGETLEHAWDTEHLPAVDSNAPLEALSGIETERDRPIPLYLASVVPQQTALWQTYPELHLITLDQLPLQGLYPTLGIDRALALLGAAKVWGLPTLVLDAGTAFTFTGIDSNSQLVGGAILPGLKLQLQSLSQRTANLPAIELPQILPPRWGLNTPTAIQSGVIYTLLAGVRDFIQTWLQQLPESQILLTGGDRTLLLTYLQTQSPDIANRINTDPNLVFGEFAQSFSSSRSLIRIENCTIDFLLNINLKFFTADGRA